MKDMTMSKKKSERQMGAPGRSRAKTYKKIRGHSDKIQDYRVDKRNSHEMDSKRPSDQGRPNKADEDFEKMVKNKGTVWPSSKSYRDQTSKHRYSWGPSGPGRQS